MNKEEKDYTIATTVIDIVPWNEDKKKEVYELLNNTQHKCWRLSNDVYSKMYSLYMDGKRIATATGERSVDVRKKLMEERLSYAPGTNLPSEMNYASLSYKEAEYKKEINSNIAGNTVQNALKDFKNDWNDLVKGNCTIRNYRRKKMEIAMPKGSAKKDKETKEIIPGQWNSIGFTKIDNDVQLRIPGSVLFKLFFGRDTSNRRAVINKIMTGEYSCGDMTIIKTKKGYRVCIPVKYPKKPRVLDSSKCVGVDLGISIPAVCGTNFDKNREFIGSGSEIYRFRGRINARKRNLQRTSKNARGGHGRTRKLKATEALRKAESSWVKTYNHTISKRIVNFAIKNNCGTIKLELLDGFGAQHKDNIVLKNWTYFQLQTMIKYKAEKEGIEIVMIDPYHTSKTCSYCGKVHKKLTLKDREITCECGEKYNRDYNAAVNIARSDKVVTKKEECTYNILKKKTKKAS